MEVCLRTSAFPPPSNVNPRFSKLSQPIACTAGLMLAMTATLTSAATITLVNTQGVSQSWLTDVDWSNGAQPSPGNDYVVDGNRVLRTANISSDETFQGDSLTIEAGSRVALKGTGDHTVTINDLRLNGGQVSHFGSTDNLTLAGGITLANATTSLFAAGGTSSRTMGVSSLISGGGNLRANGSLVTLTGNNTYTGSTTIDANGTLQVGNGGTSGSMANTSGITNNGTLVYNRSNALSVNHAIGGSGSLTKLGAGTLTLNNTSTYSGGTSIGNNTSNVGVVNVTASNALGTGETTLISNTNGNLAGVTLNSGSGITLTNDFRTSGTGSSNNLIDNQSGNNELSGNFTLVGGGGGTTIKSSGGLLTLSGDFTVNYSGSRTLTLAGAASGSITGTLMDGNNPLVVTKRDSGTWSTSGTNTYTGNTNINAGSFYINGDSSAATGAVNVASGATLGGIGIVGGHTTLSGFLDPGQSPGTLTFSGNLTLLSGSTVQFEGGDLIDVGGILDLDSGWTLELGSDLQDGGSITVFTYDTLAGSPELNPTFDTSGLGFSPSGPLSLSDDGLGTITLNGVSIVPEPSSFALFAFGALSLLVRRRR